MRSRHETIEVVVALLEDGVSEESLPCALAAQALLAEFADADLPFAVAE